MVGIVVDLNKPGGADKIADYLKSQTENAMEIAIFECMRQLAISTPVDTGRGRYGYYCTVGKPSDAVPDAAPKRGQLYYPSPDIAIRVGEMGKFSISDTLYITNNVYYLVYQNDGTTKLPPKHFVERATANAQIAVVRYLNSKSKKSGG